jgi:hypothetical protein
MKRTKSLDHQFKLILILAATAAYMMVMILALASGH